VECSGEGTTKPRLRSTPKCRSFFPRFLSSIARPVRALLGKTQSGALQTGLDHAFSMSTFVLEDATRNP
jgi:hypothetical protein